MKRFVLLTCVLLLMSVGGYLAGAVVDRFFHVPPMVYASAVEIKGGQVEVGGHLDLLVHAVIGNTSCVTSVDRQMFRVEQMSGHPVTVLVPIAPTSAVFMAPGETDFRIEIQLPRSVTAGEWIYQSRTTYACSGQGWLLGPRMLFSPKVAITVVPEGAMNGQPAK